jgi:membrane protease YdiL (CAAX protease family)
MDSSCVQSAMANSTSLLEPASPLSSPGAERPLRLAAETVLVTTGVFVAVRVLYANPVGGGHWLLIPGILVAAALLPTWIARREFPPIGLKRRHAIRTLRTVCMVGLCVLPIVLLGLWIASRMRLPVPLRPAIDSRNGWLAWLLYQLLYVAVAEEVFFRGYVQANVMRVLTRWQCGSWTVQQSVAIVVSAGCFASAHVVVQGHALAFLTFLPGLLLAWLFVRTRSLLGPMLFHGLANVSYGIMASALV